MNLYTHWGMQTLIHSLHLVMWHNLRLYHALVTFDMALIITNIAIIC